MNLTYLVLCVCLGLFTLSGNAFAQQFVTYDNPNLGVRIEIPYDWRVDESLASPPLSEIAFRSPDQDVFEKTGASILIEMDRLPYLDIPITVYDSQHFPIDTKSVRDLQSNSSVYLDGIPAISYNYKDDEDQMHWFQVRTTSGHYLYQLRFVAFNEKYYQTYLPSFNHALESFNIISTPTQESNP